MTEFLTLKKTFVKSSNNTSKILFRYSISLILFLLYIISCYLLKKDYAETYKLLIAFFTSSLISILFQLLINYVRKKKGFIKIFTEDNVLASSIIISLFSYKEKLIVVIVASLISEIVKIFNRNIGLSSSLYGILFILIYQKVIGIEESVIEIDNILNSVKDIAKLSLGLTFKNLSPIISIILLFYLFQKKSIKYPVVFSYIISFIIIITLYSFLNKDALNIFINYIIASNFIFIAVFTSSDYKITPISEEGGIIYGLILTIITFLISIIDINLAPVVSCIILPLFLTKIIDKISFKLKYNRKFYRTILLITILVTIIITVIVALIK